MTWDAVEKAKKSKTFCIIPWVHQYVGTAGDVKPCCVYEHQMELGNLKDNSLKEIWNNDATKSLRLKFLNGEMDKGCHNCDLMTTLTDSNQNSRSQFNNRFFDQEYAIDAVKSTEPDGSVPEHILYYMDVRFNNLCNFKCRTCSPHFSTSWILDYRKLQNIQKNQHRLNNAFQYPGNSEDHAYNEMLPHIPKLKQVYFAGGEPLIQIHHYQTLQKLIESGNTDCHIIYNTNLSKLKLQEHDPIEYWKKFQRIIVLASIDGSHAKAEYWRHGTIWKDIVDNVKRIKQEVPHVRLDVSYTLSWPSAIDMVDFHKEWVELGIFKPEDLNINLLTGPHYYRLAVLPNWKKQQIEKIYREHIEWIKSVDTKKACDELLGKLEHAIDYMYNGDPKVSVKDTMHHFNMLTSKLDEIRNEDFFSVYPEHQDLKDWMIEQGIIK